MRVCVVGNGPSAAGRAKEIDACDRVVRMTGWWVSGSRDTGERLDAYAWFGAQEQSRIPSPFCDRGFEHWFTLPLTRCNPPNVGHGGWWQTVIVTANLRPIRWVTERMWQREMAALTLRAERLEPVIPPSTGFTAIDLALHIYDPHELVLFGFDATVKGKPGWGDTNPQWTDTPPHDFATEKAIIMEFAETHNWLGRHFGAKVVWPDCPIG